MAQAIALPTRPHYRIDNDIVDEYGAKIGAIGIAIYNVPARHADRKTGLCYPCIGTIAKKLALGRTTVRKYLRILLNHSLIAISSRLSDEGDPTSNCYRLLDPSPEKWRCEGDNWKRSLSPSTARFGLTRPRAARMGVGRQMTDPPAPPRPTLGRQPTPNNLLPEQERKNKPPRAADAEKPGSPHAPAPTIDRAHAAAYMCPPPAEEIVHLSDGLVICNHCYSLLDEHSEMLPPPLRGTAQLSPVSGYGQTDVRPDEPTSYRTPVCGWVVPGTA